MAFTPDFFTGFEMASWGGGGGIQTTPVKTGTYCLGMGWSGGGDASSMPAFSGDNDEVYIGMWIRHNSLRQSIYLYLKDGNYIRFMLHAIDPDPSSYLRVYINTTLVATATVLTPINVYYHLQIHVKIADSGGIIQVKYEGLEDLIIDYTGDTKPGSSSYASYVYLSCGSIYGGQQIYLDDYFQGTGGWPGDLRVEVKKPNSDHLENWIPSSGSDNYAMINDTPPSDSSYIYTETNNQQNLVGLSSWDDTNKIPKWLMHWARVKKDPANIQTFKFVEEVDDVQSVSDANALTTTIQQFRRLLLLDPSGNAWTTEHINALYIGLEAQI